VPIKLCCHADLPVKWPLSIVGVYCYLYFLILSREAAYFSTCAAYMWHWHQKAGIKGETLLLSGVQTPVVDEERMRPGLVLCVPFRVLTLMIGRREGHPAHKKLSCSHPVWVWAVSKWVIVVK